MRYYEVYSGREELRLDALCKLEFEITKRAILDAISEGVRLSVLDIGGATGKYSFWLREHGHAVTLIDRSPKMIELAKERYASEIGMDLPEMRIEVGDAIDLSHLPDRSFDMILSLGPQYHLFDDDDIRRSLAELRRLIKPSGLVFSAFLHRLGTLRWWWNKRPDLFLANLEFFEDFRKNGVFPEVEWSAFNSYRAYYPDQVISLMDSAGFTTTRLLNCEGYGGTLGLNDDLYAEDIESLATYAYQRAEDPDSIQLAEHLLWVGKPK